MALDEGYGSPIPRPRGGIGTPLYVPKRRGRENPANGPLLMALLSALGGDRPQGRPDGGRFAPFLSEKFSTFDDSDVDTPHAFAQNPAIMHHFGVGRPPGTDLLERPPFGGEPREYGPMHTHQGSPWGMDTDPGDAMALRNLLALRNPDDFPGAPYPIPNAQGVAEPQPIPNFRPTGRQVPVPLGQDRGPGLGDLLDKLGSFLTGDGFGPPPGPMPPPIPATNTSTVRASTFLGRMKKRRAGGGVEAALSNAMAPYQLARME